jgi:hypothetical protein
VLCVCLSLLHTSSVVTARNLQLRILCVYRFISEWLQSHVIDMTVLYVVSKIFWTDAVKIIKLTIRPIGRHHPRSSSLPHVDTGPTVSSVFGTLPGSHFLSEFQALCVIQPGYVEWYQTGFPAASLSFLEIERTICVCVCVYVYIYTHTHTHRHTHRHTHSRTSIIWA